jgi:hypothetical protein
MLTVETRISLPDQEFLVQSTVAFRRAVHETAVLAEMHAKRLQSGPVLNVRSGFLSTRTTATVTW